MENIVGNCMLFCSVESYQVFYAFSILGLILACYLIKRQFFNRNQLIDKTYTELRNFESGSLLDLASDSSEFE